jgi:ABC-type transport system involved in multi-copper enzyme maturation permease subunit
VIVLGVAYLGVYTVGFYFLHRDISSAMASGIAQRLEPINFFVMAGLYGVNFLVVMLAILASVDTIAGEIASGTIHTVVTKPLRRWEVVVGKWLGLASCWYIYRCMGAALIGIVWMVAEYLPPIRLPAWR